MLPDAVFLAHADYQQSGGDLLITGPDGSQILVTGYFNLAEPPLLVAPTGSHLDADFVSKLVGPRVDGAFAQVGETPAGEPIGEVLKVDGDAHVIRAGTGETVDLAVGTAVYQDDVIVTDAASTLGLIMVDQTALTVAESTRLVLDQLVYNPGGGDNSMLLSLVSGSFAFVTGEIAPAGGMEVRTPVATLGIRGTSAVSIFDPVIDLAQFINMIDPLKGTPGTLTILDADRNLLAQVSGIGEVASFNGVQFLLSLLNISQQQYTDNMRDLLVQTLELAGIEVTFSEQDGERRYSLILPEDFTIPDGHGAGGSGGDLVGAGGSGDGSGGGQEAADLNYPPFGPFLASTTNEDAGVFSRNLLDFWYDPELHDLDVEGVSVVSDDGRALTFSVTNTPDNIATFRLDTNQFDDLALGEIRTVTVFYRVTDGTFTGPGVAPIGQFTLTVEGRNDTPLIGVIAGDRDADDVDESNAALSTSGSLTVSGADVDTSDVVLATVSSVAPLVNAPTAVEVSVNPDGDIVVSGDGSNDRTITNETLLRYLILSDIGGAGADAADAGSPTDPEITILSAGETSDTLFWHFDSNLSGVDGIPAEAAIAEAFNFLPEGAELTLTYTITLNDQNGIPLGGGAGGGSSTSTKIVTILITGTNDVPTISVPETNATALIEAGADTLGVAMVDGNVSGSWNDLDSGETANLAVTMGAFDGDDQTPLTFNAGDGDEAEIAGVYGTLFLKADGSYRYVLDNTLEATQALDTGDLVSETFNYTIANDVGPEHEATSSITVNIEGANDAPVLTLAKSAFVLDAFTSQDYGAWAETGDGANTAASGNIRLVANPVTAGDHQIKFTDGGGALFRTFDLVGATSAILAFDFLRDLDRNGALGGLFDGADSLSVYASSDGSSFTEIGRISRSGNHSHDGAFQSFTADLTPFISPDTTVAFSAGNSFEGNDSVVVDNISVDYTTGDPVPAGTPVAVSLGTLIGDVDDDDMGSATVVLTNAQAGDQFLVNGTTSGDINGITYLVAGDGASVAFTGIASIADYQAAIDSVVLVPDAASADKRTVDVTVNDGEADSNTVTVPIDPIGSHYTGFIGDGGTAYDVVPDGLHLDAVSPALSDYWLFYADAGQVTISVTRGELDYFPGLWVFEGEIGDPSVHFGSHIDPLDVGYIGSDFAVPFFSGDPSVTFTADGGYYTAIVTSVLPEVFGDGQFPYTISINGNTAPPPNLDPIVLDLNGDGVRFSDGVVGFDYDADGELEQIGWASGEDGILAFDVDGDGAITSGAELVSPEMFPDAASSLDALAAFDSNHDGIIDESDDLFADLVVWQDANENGVSDAGELLTLEDLGIVSIDLDAAGTGASDDAGNIIVSEGRFNHGDGTGGDFAEVAFARGFDGGGAIDGTGLGDVITNIFDGDQQTGVTGV